VEDISKIIQPDIVLLDNMIQIYKNSSGNIEDLVLQIHSWMDEKKR